MKKTVYYMIICLMSLLILAPCDEEASLEKPIPEPTESSIVQQPEPQEEPEPIPEPEPTPELKPEPTPEPEPEPTPEPSLEPSPEPEPQPQDITKVTVTIPEVSGYPEQSYGSPYTGSGVLSNEKLSWYFNRNKDHVPPTAQRTFDIRPFGGYYLGDTGSKVLYLTFDEGYENGYTEKILDVLLEKDVQAAFFVTKTYIDANPDLILRMANEGHIVGNHSVTHKDMPDLSDGDVLWELEETAATYKALTGLDMPPFFRPPSGVFSARTLQLTMEAGYKTIFWSSAYKDWEVDNQPGKAVAYETFMNDLHNGSIPLLHAVSQSNTEALPDIIDSVREHGYTFRSLYDLP